MVNKHKQTFSNGIKKKDVFIGPEDIVEGRRYAITFNPVATINEFRDLREFLEDMRKLFDGMKCCKVRLYLETSKTGRLHFHGFIWFIRKIRFAIYDVPKLIDKGSTHIKDMYLDEYNDNIYDSHLAWLMYCIKIQNEMQDYIMSELLPMVQKDKNFDCTDRYYIIDTY